jgi:ribose transport system substrate-binding protein
MKISFSPAIFLSLAVTTASSVGGTSPDGKEFVFSLFAPPYEDSAYSAEKKGAQAEADELFRDTGIKVNIDWHAQFEDDAQKQVNAVQRLVNTKVAGIAVNPLDPALLTPLIDKAVDSGVQVVTFGSDAPNSKRLALLATDDLAFGQQIMAELAKQMEQKGVAAILAGNQNSPKIQRRLKGIIAESQKYRELKVLDTYFCREDPEDAARTVQLVMRSHPEITGWAMLGSWPLYADDTLKWYPGEFKVVAVGEWGLIPDFKAGLVQAFLVDPSYQLGVTAVQTLFQKIVKQTDPKSKFRVLSVPIFDNDSADEYIKGKKPEAFIEGPVTN